MNPEKSEIIRLNGTLRYEYAYDANSELSFVKDVRDGSIVWTVKDLAGRLSEVRSSDGSVARYTYNSASQFTKLTEILSGNTLIKYHRLFVWFFAVYHSFFHAVAC